ncbi:MAG: hypothetical protein U9Q06_04735 [Nanoarchaeota archaeon]|nr:hypothetical protein [Nanoarchaeota archaeon]
MISRKDFALLTITVCATGTLLTGCQTIQTHRENNQIKADSSEPITYKNPRAGPTPGLTNFASNISKINNSIGRKNQTMNRPQSSTYSLGKSIYNLFRR